MVPGPAYNIRHPVSSDCVSSCQDLVSGPVTPHSPSTSAWCSSSLWCVMLSSRPLWCVMRAGLGTVPHAVIVKRPMACQVWSHSPFLLDNSHHMLKQKHLTCYMAYTCCFTAVLASSICLTIISYRQEAKVINNCVIYFLYFLFYFFDESVHNNGRLSYICVTSNDCLGCIVLETVTTDTLGLKIHWYWFD